MIYHEGVLEKYHPFVELADFYYREYLCISVRMVFYNAN